ncbi:tripartite-type tricarboxylate transporter receptor subunit TctC [Variovorax boronicumulans]|uniref:Tripartite-type tricarboxylate transporter receptor subunit TctC n=1 Tax=Variovorax boronicumulans TaxID=436515 RepID=A0AAW8DTP9_9BURK|nr:tripartite tricarboxylate transporter substrate binding protein [Variovorax boronicumulans]MDP9877536.1 tripartite-type tricarboxylate transporter receptor subunit TctC [Variovorax boronicumulans]MDP9922821.1 tripartite-type tricarboxylate transporter receptor subunit TctC [Variovorax boronicumulans]
MSTTRRLVLASALAASALTALPVLAEGTYPTKTVSVVVSYPPGGDTDAIARLFADKLGQRLKQSVIVDNKPGAGGAIGNGFVGRAAPDGYTLLFTPNPFTTAPLVMKLSGGAAYDVLGGYEAVINTASQPLVLVANPAVGVKTLPELVAAAKAGKTVSYASPGAGSPMHIVGEWLNKAAGVKFSHVPYRGVGPSVTDVVAGHVDTAWVTFGAVRQYLQAGKLIPLAIGDAQRSKLAPNVPTLVELGYKDVVVGAWNGFFAPKGTPAPVVKLLNEHLNAILKEPEVVEKLAVFGALPAGGAPAALAQLNQREYAVMGKAIRELGISAE